MTDRELMQQALDALDRSAIDGRGALKDALRAALAQPTPAVPDDAALNTLARVFHSGEEIEGDDGAAMMVDMTLWNEGCEALESLIGEGDHETLASSAAPAVPADMVMVPREPTPGMIAAIPFPTNVTPNLGVACYRAMIAAAPGSTPAAPAVPALTKTDIERTILFLKRLHAIEEPTSKAMGEGLLRGGNPELPDFISYLAFKAAQMISAPAVREPLEGAVDPDCNYIAPMGKVCNKCGRIHRGITGDGK